VRADLSIRVGWGRVRSNCRPESGDVE
jgi:hypothetical protein